MTTQDRIVEAERRFEEYKQQREELLKQAEDIFTEMTKLQGEYRALVAIRDDEEKQVNKQPTVIEAVPVKKGKK